ncbi:MAG: STAS domain-containing protein [Clostridiales bacterium]|nr:STAS domain-containing protein [Clostridiales bacterium]
MDLKIVYKFFKESSIWKIGLDGDLEINSSIVLKDKLNEILDQKDANIEFNFEKLSYIDSTGLGVLISLLKRLNKNGFTMSVINPQDNILKIFKITGLYKVIKIYKEGELIEG